MIKYKIIWFNICHMQSFPLPSSWSFSVVCGFLSRAVGGRRVGVASASPESDSGGARDPVHCPVPGMCLDTVLAALGTCQETTVLC